MEKHKERKRACVPLQGAVSIETSYISFDDCFAALQIDLCVRGWIEGLWRNRRLHHPHQFPNYVRSIKRDSAPPPKECRLLYSVPSTKTRRRGNFPSAPDFLDQTDFIVLCLAPRQAYRINKLGLPCKGLFPDPAVSHKA